MARLPQGIIKRKDGTLQRRFTINGKRYSIYGHSVEEINEKEHRKREELKSGVYSNNDNITLDRYFLEFLEQKSNFVKANTIYTYKSVYPLISAELGKCKVKKIERRQCLHLQKELKKTKAAKTVNNTMGLLNNILTAAKVDGIIINNPMDNIKAIPNEKKSRQTIHRALTIEEQKEFMRIAKENSFYYEFMAFMLLTGMRCGEVGALSWRDVDYKNSLIHVTKTISKDANGKLLIQTPKTKSSVRDIPITPTIKKILQQQKEKEKLLNNIVNFDNRVFSSIYGAYVRAVTIDQEIKRLLKGTQIERFTSHCFRDTFATRYIEQGGTPQTLKTILGHSSITMTMDLYAHVLPNTKQKEMNNIIIAI